MVLTTTVLVLVQAGIGMAVNLYVTVPGAHPGAGAADYFSGSFNSVVWAIGHGETALAIHAALGFAVAGSAIGAAVQGLRLGGRGVALWPVLGAVLVLAAGGNGAAFLDYNHDTNSLLMALLAFGAVGCYAIALFRVGRLQFEGAVADR
jgi:hypothetical protein